MTFHKRKRKKPLSLFSSLHIFPGLLAYTHLFNVREPVSPVWLAEVVVLDVLHDLGEVVLGRVPTTNAVISSEVAFNLETISR